jgi:hypothetical protein
MDDQTPDEPDYISPDFLGQGNFALIAGPPKAQKSFLLTEMLVAAATGGTFLSGRFSVPRPLKVFYVQAEMNRKLLKRRAKMMTFLSNEEKALVSRNLAVTARLTMILDAGGVDDVVEAINARFPDGGPDIIAIDPLANLFDGDNEDKAPEVMRFLTLRLEAVRRRTNPLAAIVLVHHSSKKSTEDMARDPFVAIRGSGALRGYYDTGIVIFRQSEEGPDRRIHFELRNGDSPEPVTVRLAPTGRLEEVDASSSGITRSIAVAMLAEIDRRWREGNPLSPHKRARAEGRYAGFELSKKFGARADTIDQLVADWQSNRVVEFTKFSAKGNMYGLRKIVDL